MANRGTSGLAGPVEPGCRSRSVPSVKASDTSETRSKDSLGPTLNGMEAAALIGSFSHRQDAASRPVPALKEAFDEVVLLVLNDLPKSVWWPPSIATAQERLTDPLHVLNGQMLIMTVCTDCLACWPHQSWY